MNNQNTSNAATTISITEKELLTVKEAAQLFNIGQNTIRNLTSGTHNPLAVWIGNKRLIKRAAFRDFIFNDFCA